RCYSAALREGLPIHREPLAARANACSPSDPGRSQAGLAERAGRARSVQGEVAVIAARRTPIGLLERPDHLLLRELALPHGISHRTGWGRSLVFSWPVLGVQ